LANMVSLEDNDLVDPESLAIRCFGDIHAAWLVAMKKNSWRPTTEGILDDVQNSCVEMGHGGNSIDYTPKDVVCVDMKECYSASFQGKGKAAPWFQGFGHPGHCRTRVSIHGPLPADIGTGFAEVQKWEWKDTYHPVIATWFGRHFVEKMFC
jgi:hypothetical protein